MDKSELQIERVVQLIDTIGVRASCEHDVQLIVLAVCQCDELIRGVTEAFCGTWVDGKPSTLEGNAFSASPFYVLILELTKKTRS